MMVYIIIVTLSALNSIAMMEEYVQQREREEKKNACDVIKSYVRQ